ncbi:GNAT family N-acetyltransferase [Bradyrhizobium manausense]|uniref:GNAT family N-acetyltransferase n=1 Tax=Bradyrhizobium manausense TaxID=989370 RepID=UPI001BA5B8C0|nr:GNAT family N-acetyltransferase [Bradyrhizobium manausense]MBR1089628.1 GNAT family N-acetyltransferase [Bradyrhizobium manausense]
MNPIDNTAKALALWELFRSAPAENAISNLSTQVGLRQLDRHLLPVTVNSASEPTCYLCCPSVAYVDYARDELRHFSGHRLLYAMLHGLLKLGYPLIRAAGLDRQVQVNNWLLATNPIPDVTFEPLRAATQAIAQEHPGHVVVWRSLNDFCDRESMQTFRRAGYRMYPARQIYLFDCRDAEPKLGRDERRDRALLEDSGLAIVASAEFRDDDFVRARMLYQHLYLEKYTWLNPQYTAEFVKAAHAGGILEFQGVRAADGQLAGVIAFFDAGRTMTAPIVGYDATLPRETGLYRMLMALAFRRARERKMLFNMSAGAASFKRNRGGVAALEYSAIYNAHFAPTARLAASLVRTILQRVGIPVLRSFEL